MTCCNMYPVGRWLLAIASLLCLLMPGVLGHGIMISPVSRNYYAYLNSSYLGQPFWNPQGNNGGGPLRVSRQNSMKWPNGQFGLCGDPYEDEQLFMKPLPIRGQYRAGGEITTKIILYNNHMGQWRMNLCRSTATKDSWKQDCMPLRLAHDNSPIYIPPPPKCNCNWASDGKDSGMPATLGPGLTLETYQGEGQFNGYPVMIVNWKIPSNANCQGDNYCILQWHWITATSCEPPCTTQLDSQCGTRGWTPCGDTSAYPEEFWNCADVEIAPARRRRRSSRKMLQANGTTQVQQDAARPGLVPENDPLLSLLTPDIFGGAQLAGGQQAAGQPGAGQPAVGQPATGQPGAGQPAAGQPAMGQPAVGQPAMAQAATGQPAVGQPAMAQAAMGQPAVGQPGVASIDRHNDKLLAELNEDIFSQQAGSQQPSQAFGAQSGVFAQTQDLSAGQDTVG